MSFTCPRCGLTSHHPRDEAEQYCGHCHDWTGEQAGRHAAGCFYGGPIGEGYWFAVNGCLRDHDGESETLWAPAENVAAAYDHLRQAGMLRTDESG